jgi:hypothetical protein
MELSERILRLLGKRDDDPVLLEFLNEFKPQLHSYSYELLKLYNFSSLGFSLFYDGAAGSIERVLFHIFTKRVATGNCKPFDGLLPFAIPASSTRDAVRELLGVEPERSEHIEEGEAKTSVASWHDKYRIAPWIIDFEFGSAAGSLRFMSVSSEDSIPLRDQSKIDAMLWRKCNFCGETHDAASRFVVESNEISICNVCVEGYVNQFRDRRDRFNQAAGCSFCSHRPSRQNASLRIAPKADLSICEICAEELNEGLARFVDRTKLINKIAEPDMHFPDFEPHLDAQDG